MANVTMAKVLKAAKTLLVYEPPTQREQFVLGEAREGDLQPEQKPAEALLGQVKQLGALVRHAQRLADFIERANTALRGDPRPGEISALKAEVELLRKTYAELSTVLIDYSDQVAYKAAPVAPTLKDNETIIRSIYVMSFNKDIVVRKFTILTEPPIAAMLVYQDGLSDKKLINGVILQPLMVFAAGKRAGKDDVLKAVIEEWLPSNQVTRESDYKQVTQGINNGDSALFIEGCTEVVLVETKGWEHRNVDRPQIEQTIRGGQEAFGEVIKVNTALIRKKLRASDLITEMYTLGARSRTDCAIMYIKSIANPDLVAEVRRRITSIQSDYVADSGMLESFIEDYPGAPFPQTMTTERPDRVSASLAEGRVAILCDGSPFVLVVPVNLFSFFHSADDFATRFPVAIFMRSVRLTGAFLGTTLPSIYLALSTFHQEAIPTELALAIAGARERVPFPIVIEILLMELSFELIREAGLRIPGTLGSTIGIVGAIILGQAAVAANIVSPIMVVIIAMSGLASFTITDFIVGFAARLLRFAFLLLAWVAGFVGIADGLLVLVVGLCSLKSFGVPYLSPVAPKTSAGFDTVLRGQTYRQEKRPDEYNPQDSRRQPATSRIWTTGSARKGRK